MDNARGAHLPLAKGFRLRGIKPDVDAGSCCGEMGEGTRRRARREPYAAKSRPVWTASSLKTRPKWVWRGLVDLSTISNRSTPSKMVRCLCDRLVHGDAPSNEISFVASLAKEHRSAFRKLFSRWRAYRYFGRNLGSLNVNFTCKRR